MTRLLTALMVLLAQPALAADGPFISLRNTNFIVLLAFIVFILILLYFKVPGTIVKMLDGRAETIRSELDEARALREEAQSLLASYERKQKEVQEQADRIVESARAEAERSAAQAKEDIAASVARRLAAAEDQINGARKAAEAEVRHAAVDAAVSAAREALVKGTTATSANKLIDDAIAQVDAKLH